MQTSQCLLYGPFCYYDASVNILLLYFGDKGVVMKKDDYFAEPRLA